MSGKTAQFANFIVKFEGENLLDHFEIVSRAFLDDTHVRGYGRTQYHFFETKLEVVDEEDPASLTLYGRFIKDTILERDQYYKDGKLNRDHDELPSSPSAFFALILAPHRIVYVPETRFAPTLSEFEATIKRFILDEHHRHKRKLYEYEKDNDPSYTLVKAARDLPQPTVNIVPLKSDEGIESFIARFAKIDRVQVSLIERNNEFDPKSATENFQRYVLSPLDPRKAKLSISGDQDGLPLKETENFIKNTAGLENDKISVNGKDQFGHKLKGNNDNFKLQVAVDEDFVSGHRAKSLYHLFQNMVSQGSVRNPLEKETEKQAVIDKIKKIAAMYL